MFTQVDVIPQFGWVSYLTLSNSRATAEQREGMGSVGRDLSKTGWDPDEDVMRFRLLVCPFFVGLTTVQINMFFCLKAAPGANLTKSLLTSLSEHKRLTLCTLRIHAVDSVWPWMWFLDPRGIDFGWGGGQRSETQGTGRIHAVALAVSFYISRIKELTLCIY